MRLLLLSLLLTASASAQELGTISGTISDAETGEPLIGASAYLVGTQIGAAAGLDGRYTIAEVPPGAHTVRLAYIGYEPVDALLDVAEGERVVLDVALELSGDLTICVVLTCPEPVWPRGPYIARVALYEGGHDGCYPIEPGGTYTRDG